MTEGVKYGKDIELEQWANALLAEDAKADGKSMPDYRREYGLIQRRKVEEVSFEPEILALLVDQGRATKVP